MTTDCPICGEPAFSTVATGPGVEKYAPCGCRVALDGGSIQGDEGKTGARSADDTDRYGDWRIAARDYGVGVSEPGRRLGVSLEREESQVKAPRVIRSRSTDSEADR